MQSFLRRVQLPCHRSSDSGTAVSSVGSVVITTGIFSDIHPFGVLLKDRLPERGLAKAMNLGSVSSSSSKSGTLNLTIFDAFSKPPNGVATLWESKEKQVMIIIQFLFVVKMQTISLFYGHQPIFLFVCLFEAPESSDFIKGPYIEKKTDEGQITAKTLCMDSYL